MIILDATALVAFLAGERSAGQVESILRGGEVVIASVNLAETIDVLTRVRGVDVDALEAKLVPLLATNLQVLSVGETEARKAASLRAAHYHRRLAPLSLADCMVLAVAWLLGGTIATSDDLLAVAARREGLEVTQLPADKRP